MFITKKSIRTAFHLTFFVHLLILNIYWLTTADVDAMARLSDRLLRSFYIQYGGLTSLLGLAVIIGPIHFALSKETAKAARDICIISIDALGLPKPRAYWKLYFVLFYTILVGFISLLFVTNWSQKEEVQTFLNVMGKMLSLDFDALVYWEVTIGIYFLIYIVRCFSTPIVQGILMYFQFLVLFFIAMAASVFGYFFANGVLRFFNDHYDLSAYITDDLWFAPFYNFLGILAILFFRTMDAYYPKYLALKQKKLQ